MWMVGLFLSGDIESNPGPPKPSLPQTTLKLNQTLICSIRNKPINLNQYSILYNSTPSYWIHKNCIKIQLQDYHSLWTCNSHTQPSITTQQLNYLTLTSIRRTLPSN